MIGVYISGPMTGYPDYNFAAFNEAERRLVLSGYHVYNPAQELVSGWKYQDYLRRSLRMLLSADAVATLPYWQGSFGAKIEVDIAMALKMPVLPVEDF